MPTTMSKMLHLGLGIDEILLASTATPARVVNRVPLLGTLQVGAPADIALLKVEEGSFPLVDSQRNTVAAKRRFVCVGAVCRGVRLS
jgi:dihydroorotase